MAGLTDYAENKMLDHFSGVASYTLSNRYLGLFSVAPTDSTSGTELSGSGYARVSINGLFAAASGGSASNNAAIEFSAATADWAAVVAFGIFDASTSGNLLAYGTISKTISNGDIARFAAGNLVITMD